MRLLRLSFFIVLACITQVAKAQHIEDSKPVVHSDTVWVKGLVDTPAAITMKNIKDYTVTEVKSMPITEPGGTVKHVMPSFKGVLLTDILKKDGVTMAQKKDRGKYYVAVRATDGYTVLFAWNELQYGPAGKGTYLIFEEDGKPIPDSGPFVLTCTTDVATGPRHVRWVQSITVGKLD